MTNEQQYAAARAFRAWLGLDQKEAALAAGIGEKTLMRVERGIACSEKIWSALTAFYASRGLEIRDGEPLIVLIHTAS